MQARTIATMTPDIRLAPPTERTLRMPSPGRVYLVGAGPGDAGLLTLEGARRLGQADVVLYDYLANDALLRHASSEAELVGLGRHGAGKLWSQTEINDRMVAEALAGKTVVRLKGGDPGVFGRLAEEVAACRKAGLEYAIVPGVTTAVAAGAYADMTLTDRDHASAVAFVTGHPRSDGAEPTVIDFGQLAAFPGTLVVYMGVTTAPDWSARLIDGGKSPKTPVTIVRRCSLPDQQTIRCTLGEVATVLAPQRMRPPIVVIIGEVAAGQEGGADWFASRPLFGKTVVVTRPARQAGPMVERLSDLGARVLLQPAIEIAPAPDAEAVDRAIERLGSFDWVVFSSRNGVDSWLSALGERGLDARAFGKAKVAAIGPATVEALDAWRLKADLCPGVYDADALAEALRSQVADKRVLLVRASRGRETLAEQLGEAGAHVEQVVAYESRDVSEADAGVLAEIAGGRVDWITATSSAIARSLTRLLGPSIAQCPTPPRIVAISPLTAGALAEAGLPADAVANEATGDGVVGALLRAEQAD